MKAEREIERLLDAYGFVEVRRGKHHVYKSPHVRENFILPQSPSDRRAALNNLAKLRRITKGVPMPTPEKIRRRAQQDGILGGQVNLAPPLLPAPLREPLPDATVVPPLTPQESPSMHPQLSQSELPMRYPAAERVLARIHAAAQAQADANGPVPKRPTIGPGGHLSTANRQLLARAIRAAKPEVAVVDKRRRWFLLAGGERVNLDLWRIWFLGEHPEFPEIGTSWVSQVVRYVTGRRAYAKRRDAGKGQQATPPAPAPAPVLPAPLPAPLPALALPADFEARVQAEVARRLEARFDAIVEARVKAALGE